MKAILRAIKYGFELVDSDFTSLHSSEICHDRYLVDTVTQ